MLRAGFGANQAQIDAALDRSIPDLLEELFAHSATYKDIHYLPIIGFCSCLFILSSDSRVQRIFQI